MYVLPRCGFWFYGDMEIIYLFISFKPIIFLHDCIYQILYLNFMRYLFLLQHVWKWFVFACNYTMSCYTPKHKKKYDTFQISLMWLAMQHKVSFYQRQKKGNFSFLLNPSLNFLTCPHILMRTPLE